MPDENARGVGFRAGVISVALLRPAVLAGEKGRQGAWGAKKGAWGAPGQYGGHPNVNIGAAIGRYFLKDGGAWEKGEDSR